MTQVRLKCRAGLPWEPFQCPHPAEKNRLCVFHVPKWKPEEKEKLSPSDLATAERLAQKCRQEFVKFLEVTESLSEKTFFDFRGFHLPALDLEGRTFKKKVEFRDAVFYDDALFKGTTFDQGADFENATFYGTANFDEAKIKEHGGFALSAFKQATSFRKAVFTQADFTQVVFEQQSDFNTAEFKEVGLFQGTVFGQLVDFSGATFKSAIFSRADFREPAHFSGVKFKERADFLGAAFKKDAQFIGGQGHRCFSECDFRRLKLEKDAELIFERTSLSAATFLDTNLERVTFRDVEWHQAPARIRGWMNRPKCLWDEFDSSRQDTLDKETYEKIGENYSQLVTNYESRRDFGSAESFYVGEMEIQRKKKGVGYKRRWARVLRERINEYGIYRLTSNYGTSYVQALVVLGLMIFLLSTLFLFSGFQSSKEPPGRPPRGIEYDLWADPTHHPAAVRQLIGDFGASVSLLFSIITFQKDRFYEPLEGPSRLLLYLSTIILTAQTALVLLAIRRRFKR